MEGRAPGGKARSDSWRRADRGQSPKSTARLLRLDSRGPSPRKQLRRWRTPLFRGRHAALSGSRVRHVREDGHTQGGGGFEDPYQHAVPPGPWPASPRAGADHRPGTPARRPGGWDRRPGSRRARCSPRGTRDTRAGPPAGTPSGRPAVRRSRARWRIAHRSQPGRPIAGTGVRMCAPRLVHTTVKVGEPVGTGAWAGKWWSPEYSPERSGRTVPPWMDSAGEPRQRRAPGERQQLVVDELHVQGHFLAERGPVLVEGAGVAHARSGTRAARPTGGRRSSHERCPPGPASPSAAAQPTPASTRPPRATATPVHRPAHRSRYPAPRPRPGRHRAEDGTTTHGGRVAPRRRASALRTRRWASTGGQRLDVVGQANARPEQGPGLDRPVQGQGRPGARPQQHPLVAAGWPARRPAGRRGLVADVDRAPLPLQGHGCPRRNDRPQPGHGRRCSKRRSIASSSSRLG